MQETKSIDDLIIKKCDVRLIADASKLLELNDDSYAKLRHVGFGASDSSKLLGKNPFSSLNDLLQEKREKAPVDPVVQFKATVRKGKELEDMVMHKAEKHLGLEIHKPANMYAYKETRLTVNFDGVFLLGDILIPLEIKVCSPYGRKHYNFNQSIKEDVTNASWTTSLKELMSIRTNTENCGFPIYYYTQLQQQIMFLNAPFGILAVLDDYNWQMNYYLILSDAIIQNDLKEAELKHRWNLHPEEEILKELNLI